jgi:hypothetical protein
VDRAELLQHAQRVHLRLLFDDPTTSQAEDGRFGNRHVPAGGGEVAELSLVRAARGKPDGYSVRFGDLAFDDVLQVWKRGEQLPTGALVLLQVPSVRRARRVHDVLRCEHAECL